MSLHDLPVGLVPRVAVPHPTITGEFSSAPLFGELNANGTASQHVFLTNPSIAVTMPSSGPSVVSGVPLKITQVSQSISTSYTANKVIGSLMPLPSLLDNPAASGFVSAAWITAASIQDAPIVVALFSSDPTASTFTDGLPPIISSADVGKLVGYMEFFNPRSYAGSHSLWRRDGLELAIPPPEQTYYAVIISLGEMSGLISTDLHLTLITKGV